MPDLEDNSSLEAMGRKSVATTVCVAGKNSVAVDALYEIAHRHQTVCLANYDDTGEDTWQPSLILAAKKLGVPLVSLDEVEKEKDICFLSLEYATLIRPERFATDRLFNIHLSLLPKYRGCNTSIWPILNGEEMHGVTLHEIDPGVDTGAVIDQEGFLIGEMTSYEMYLRCLKVGTELALRWLPRLLSGDYKATPQSELGEPLSYKRKELDFGLAEIDLSLSTQTVLRRVRAFNFPVYQRASLNGRNIISASADAGAEGQVFKTADGSVRLVFE